MRIPGHWVRHIKSDELNKQKPGFTILELIVVVVILGVIAIITLPGFNKARENSLDQEASANLKLIQAAEKIYKLEMTMYFNATNATDINSYLKLALPTASINWNYKVDSATDTLFTGKAQRAGYDSRVMWINQSANDTTSNGTW